MKLKAAVGLLSCAVLFQSFSLAQEASPAANSASLAVPDSPGAVQARRAQAVNPAESVSSQESAAVNASRVGAPRGTSAPSSEVSSDQVVEARVSSAQEPSQTTPAPKPQTDVPDMPPMAGEQAGSEAVPSGSGRVTIHEPVGTAVAEPLQTTGVAASRPAGAAVAPAEQHRVRTILIRVGSLVGAGVAIGTTMALSQASPSKPPGSH